MRRASTTSKEKNDTGDAWTFWWGGWSLSWSLYFADGSNSCDTKIFWVANEMNRLLFRPLHSFMSFGKREFWMRRIRSMRCQYQAL